MSAPRAGFQVVLKLATSLDGRIALANGQSRWITGPQSRAEVHRLRSRADVILTGAGTVRADDPEMTVRDMAGFDGEQPACAVLDGRLSTPPDAKLFEASRTVTIYTLAGSDHDARSRLSDTGAAIVDLPEHGGRPALASALDHLAACGHGAVLVEAGAEVAASALASGRVTRIEWFRAPLVLGGDARPVFAGLALETLDRAPRFVRTAVRECGSDLHETYQRETS